MPKLQGVGGLAIDDFELVIALSSRLSVAAVARDRNTAASQVSRALSRIEQHLGARLFHRTTHGLSSSPEGRLFVEQAQRICGDANLLAEQLLATREGVEGRVRISISHILGEYVLVPAIDRLCQDYPGLKIELQLSDRLVDIASEAIDIAVRAGVPPLGTRVAQRLGSHCRGLYASTAFVEREGAPRRIEDLARYRLISNSRTAQQNQWRFERDGQTLSLPVRGDVQADNTATVVSLALSGAGIARINSVVADPHVARGALVPVLDAFADGTRHDVHAVALAGRYRTSRVRAVVGWLRTTFVAAGFSQDDECPVTHLSTVLGAPRRVSPGVAR